MTGSAPRIGLLGKRSRVKASRLVRMTGDAPRIGLLGGTFDPVHYGHLDAAEAARQTLALAEVWLIPSRVPPHKAEPAQASGYHRFAMTALAAAGRAALRLSDLELRADGPSYTSVTLRRLADAGYAPSQLFFVLGSDAFAEIAHWHDYPAILDRSHFAVVTRPGTAAAGAAMPPPDPGRATPGDPGGLPGSAPAADRRPPDAGRGESADDAGDRPVPGGRPGVWRVDAVTREVSSSLIRRRLADAAPVRGLLPDAVAAYIARHRLYRGHDDGETFA